MAGIHTHRRTLRTFVPLVLPYAQNGLVMWADTSYANPVTQDGNGLVTSWKNQVSGGPDFSASAPLAYAPDNGSNLLNLQNGSLTATLPGAVAAPATIVVVVKAFTNTPYLQYQTVAELYNPATGSYLRIFIKNQNSLLAWDGQTYFDLPGNFPINGYTALVLRTSTATYPGGDCLFQPSGQGGPMNNFYLNKDYTQISSGGGNYGLKLFMVYNRRLSDGEINTLVSTARQRFSF